MYRPTDLDVFIYLRKSRKDVEEEKKSNEQGQAFDTLDKHRKQLLELAQKERHNIIDIFEEVVSGEYISERPKMQELLREVEMGVADAVLVMDLDRLGRGDMVDQGTIYRVFRFSETLIITPSEIINPNDENQELTFSIKSLIAREELKQIVKRMQRGRKASAKEGKSISKKPPYGYRRDENLKLYPDPETAWVVQKIFTLISGSFGRKHVAQELDHLGIKPPQGEYWSPSTISSIIKNEVYLGHIIWGKLRYVKQNGKYIRKKVPKERWQKHENAHEALVSQELFNQANQSHSNRWRPPTVQTKKLANPLAGILVCELCGHSMVYQPRKDRPNPQVRCVQPSCKGKQKGASLTLVEERVLQGLKEVLESFEVEESVVQKKEQRIEEVQQKQKAIKNKHQTLEELNKQKSNLHDFLEQGVYTIETFLERQKSIAERINKVNNELQQIQEDIQVLNEVAATTEKVIPSIINVLDSYHVTNDIEKKNLLLKSVLEKVTYLREINWKKKDDFKITLLLKI